MHSMSFEYALATFRHNVKAVRQAVGCSMRRPRPFNMRRGFLGVSVTQKLTWGCPSAFAFIERHLAVDNDGLVPLGPLDPAPLAAREVVGDLADPLGVDGQPVKVVHDHVGSRAFAQHPAVAEACGLSWQ